MKVGKNDWKILFIDDEEGIRKVISITLVDAGYEVVTAEDGEKGIRLCGRESPQIVITDIRMPGMDGIEVLLTPGHTPGGQSVAVKTEAGKAVITGLCCNKENFLPGGGIIVPGVHLDVVDTRSQAFDYD